MRRFLSPHRLGQVLVDAAIVAHLQVQCPQRDRVRIGHRRIKNLLRPENVVDRDQAAGADELQT